MASFVSYLLDSEKALEAKIKSLLDMLPKSPNPDALKTEIKKLETELEELKKRRTF
jgi:hypothetical protein